MLARHIIAIHSAQNPKIKFIAQLNKPRTRRVEQLFLIEGFREIRLAQAAGYDIRQVLWCPSVASPHAIEAWIAALPDSVAVYAISGDLFAKIAYRDNVDGLIVVARTRALTLDRLRLSPNPFLLVLEAVEKPGNLGAILRTADAAGVEAVLVCDPQTDIYNPNVVRSSLGCVFACQIAVASSDDMLTFLHQRGIRTYAAALTATQYYHEADFTAATAIVMGAEAHGLTEFWLRNADAQIKIPMLGQVDSLNVSASTAILTYEARRQRGF